MTTDIENEYIIVPSYLTNLLMRSYIAEIIYLGDPILMICHCISS